MFRFYNKYPDNPEYIDKYPLDNNMHKMRIRM